MTSLRFRVFVALLSLLSCQSAHSSDYLGPSAVLASRDGHVLFVALLDAQQLAVFDTKSEAIVDRIDLPGPPTSLSLSGKRDTLYVGCAAPESVVCAVNTTSGNIEAQYKAGHTVSGLALDAENQRLFVCNRFDNDVSVIDLASASEIARVPVIREPCAAVFDSQSRAVFVANHLPLDAANQLDVAAEVTVITADETKAGFKTKSIRLPSGSTNCRGLAISPDGKWVYVTHSLARYGLPASQLERGWMNTNALSLIDVKGQSLLNTVLLDGIDSGAANPWGVAASADGKFVCVTHAGSHELSVVDIGAVTEVLLAAAEHREADPTKFDGRSLANAEDAKNDLALLHEKRRRIHLAAKGPDADVDVHAPDFSSPRDVAMAGGKAYVTGYFTDNVAIVDLGNSGHPVQLVALGEQAEVDQKRIGEMLFNDARICFQQWQSCATCHPDGRADGLNWDLLNDGLGNANNVKSMLLVDKTPPMMVSGVRADAEQAVRSGIRHILFTVREERDVQAILAYLSAIKPVPSPYLDGGKLSESAERGRRLFFSERVGCRNCHPEPLYTDLRSHEMGGSGDGVQRIEADTPTLIECWRTAPYLHDGRYTTLKQLFREGKHGSREGVIDSLKDEELNDLIEFVLSL